MNEKTERDTETENEPQADVVEGSKRRLIRKSQYIVPAILTLSVADLAKAQINLGSPPGPPVP